MKLFTVILAISLAMFAFTAQAVDIVIEGFEDATNVHIWQSVSPASQSPGTTAQAGINTESTANVVEGVESLTLTCNWDGAYAGSTGNVVVSGGPTLWWGYRINISNNTPLSFPNGETIRANFFNNSNTTTMQVAIYVADGATTSYERGPLVTLNANGSTSYEWDTSTGSAAAYLTGDGTLNQSTLYLKGIVIYTDTNPSPNTTMLIDVDNIRVVDAGDIVPPAFPVVKSVQQGPSAGELIVKWAANGEGDLAGYKVYLATDANWQQVLTNRLTIPNTPAADVASPATQTTLTGVPTDENVYVVVTAYDTSNNESPSDLVLGARLRPDAATPSDLVVLNLNRYGPADAGWITNGYFHHIVYYAQALDAHSRYFVSCRSNSIDDASVIMSSDANSVIVWSSSADGNVTPFGSLSDASIAALETLLSNNGNLFLSGLSLGLSLTAPNGSSAAQAFYANTLKAGLGTDNAATNVIDTSAPFSVGTIFTGGDIFNTAANATTDNEGLTSLGSNSAMAYNPAPGSGVPAVFYGNKVVYFGFAFEYVRHIVDNPATGGMTLATAKRAELMGTVLDYLLAGAPSAADARWNLYE